MKKLLSSLAASVLLGTTLVAADTGVPAQADTSEPIVCSPSASLFTDADIKALQDAENDYNVKLADYKNSIGIQTTVKPVTGTSADGFSWTWGARQSIEGYRKGTRGFTNENLDSSEKYNPVKPITKEDVIEKYGSEEKARLGHARAKELNVNVDFFDSVYAAFAKNEAGSYASDSPEIGVDEAKSRLEKANRELVQNSINLGAKVAGISWSATYDCLQRTGRSTEMFKRGIERYQESGFTASYSGSKITFAVDISYKGDPYFGDSATSEEKDQLRKNSFFGSSFSS
ncbi:MAG: hypothetical protein Q3962_05140 [Corynebacterium sp.]|nr:hypothetical protein [Corynebacterium sp.]